MTASLMTGSVSPFPMWSSTSLKRRQQGPDPPSPPPLWEAGREASLVLGGGQLALASLGLKGRWEEEKCHVWAEGFEPVGEGRER